MKKIILGFIVVTLFISCNKSKQIHDLKAFCNYTVECYKNNRKSEALDLRIKKEDLIRTINSMTMPNKDKKREIEGTENREKNGYFDKSKLEKAYVAFRNREKNEFWEKCSIKGYEYLTTEDFFGFEVAELIILLEYKGQTYNFKIGELIKTDKGWRILYGGPSWK